MVFFRLFFLLFGFHLCLSSAFKLLVDLNTYSSSEINFAAQNFRVDGTWSVVENSPGVNNAQWTKAINSIGSLVISEDNPNNYNDCQTVRVLAQPKALTAAFHYHETGGNPGTMLTGPEIDQASAACGGVGIIILTRAYFPGSDWRTKVESVLHHPRLYGVAMEFNPDDFGKRNEADFVREVTGAEHAAFFLLPVRRSSLSAENAISLVINGLEQQGINMKSTPLVHIVIARYDQPLQPIQGATNSIQEAVKIAKGLQSGSGNCTWIGHCAGSPCATYNDCDGDLVCKNGYCA